MKIILAIAACTLLFIGSAMAADQQENNTSHAPGDKNTPTHQAAPDTSFGFGSGTNIGIGGGIGSPTSMNGGFGSVVSNSGFGTQTFGGGFTQGQAGGSGPFSTGSPGSALGKR